MRDCETIVLAVTFGLFYLMFLGVIVCEEEIASCLAMKGKVACDNGMGDGFKNKASSVVKDALLHL